MAALGINDIKGKGKKELLELAKSRPGYDPKVHKKVEDLKKFLVPDLRSKKKTKKDELIQQASQYPDFRRSTHGKNIATIEAFLASKRDGAAPAVVIAAAAAAVDQGRDYTRQDIERMKFTDLKKLARKHGWTEKTGKRPDFLAFLLPRFPEKAGSEGRLAIVEEVDAPEIPEEVDLEEWPIPPEVVERHSKTIEALKQLLALKGIREGLPRSKKEILELLKKSRCDAGRFDCEDSEFCDLRNRLCRDLSILRDQNGEITKLAKGLKYFDEKNQRFYGDKNSIEKVRLALRTPPPGEVEEKEDEEVEDVLLPVIIQKEPTPDKLSPININNLLEKPSENEIRKAILHCLGLYNDLDPNDEIIVP